MTARKSFLSLRKTGLSVSIAAEFKGKEACKGKDKSYQYPIQQIFIVIQLPQETILFNEAPNLNELVLLTVNLSSCSNFLGAGQTIVLGCMLEAMGENICDCELIDNWRVFRDGNLFHAESFRLSNEVNKIITAPAGCNGAARVKINLSASTILYVGHNIDQVVDRK